MVPGSTLMYGSSFCMVTRRPRLFSSRPSDDAVSPLPSELDTPPVTKMCFAKVLDLLRVQVAAGGQPNLPQHPRLGANPPPFCWAFCTVSCVVRCRWFVGFEQFLCVTAGGCTVRLA